MEYKEYEQGVLRTESGDMDAIKSRVSEEQTIRLLHGAMGMATEAGELLDAIKKHVFYGKPLDVVNLKEEIGDSLWYATVLMNALGYDLNDIMTSNNAKLRARYPNKFSEYDAIHRDLDKENRILSR